MSPEPNSMSAEWCAARLLPVRHYLNNVQQKDPERFEWRAWLIELLSQVDNPPHPARLRSAPAWAALETRAATAEAQATQLREELGEQEREKLALVKELERAQWRVGLPRLNPEERRQFRCRVANGKVVVLWWLEDFTLNSQGDEMPGNTGWFTCCKKHGHTMFHEQYKGKVTHYQPMEPTPPTPVVAVAAEAAGEAARPGEEYRKALFAFQVETARVLRNQLVDPERCFTDTGKDWAEENNRLFRGLIEQLGLQLAPKPPENQASEPVPEVVQQTGEGGPQL